ncbi:MAG: hypothetical protein ACW99A_22180 [Candidatus Kariarchaeaceae archaeon]|jgi:uncharacterized membrane protein
MVLNLIEQHQALIIKTLTSHQNSLILADLKKITKLANMYFIKALEVLENKKIIERVKKEKETWIKLKK